MKAPIAVMDFCHFGRTRLVAAGLAAIVVLTLGSAEGSTIRVTTTAQQSVPGQGCTISDAILTANFGAPIGDCVIEPGPGGVVIHIPVHIPNGDPDTAPPVTPYVLTTGMVSGPDESMTAFPNITRPIMITAPIMIEGEVLPDGRRTIIIRDPDAPAFRLFRAQTSVGFRNLTLSGGDAGTNCCGARQPGGAIYAEGQGTRVVIEDVIFENNTAGHGGAIADANAVHSDVFLGINNSTFRTNHASLGGAIAVSQTAHLSIRNGHFEGNGAEQGGGAIYARPNRGAVIMVTDSEFIGNAAAAQMGGAISAFDMRLTHVTMRGNSARDGGGAVYNAEGTATIIDSTFAGNQSNDRGGAVYASGQVTVSGSTFTQNSATGRDGGAIFLRDGTGISRITNSTFSYNHAFVEGTAISTQSGELTLINDTIVSNTTTGSWGPAVRGYWNFPTIRIANSIVAGNTTFGDFPLDVYADERPGAIVSLGHNLIGSGQYTDNAFTKVGDLAGDSANPLEAGLQRGPDGQFVLAANGGPTDTHTLLLSSLALDNGSPAPPGADDACEAVDQRGVHRPGAGTSRCDIGAFEHVITYALTVHVGKGGSVFGLDGPTPCVDGECEGTFDSGTIVKLEAQPATGHTFVGWLGGGCESASEICFVTMDAAHTVTATFHSESATTTTTLTSSANPAVNGQDVTLTAVVTADEPANGTPAGSVTFANVTEGTVIGTAPLIAGTATLTRTPRSSAYVINEIKAIYTGDGTFTPGSDTISQVVNPASTEIRLTSSLTPSAAGQSVTVTAVVSATSPGSGTPTGSIIFTDLSTTTVLGTVALDATGNATLEAAALPSGIHPIKASYSGDQWFNGSDGVFQQIVNAAITTTVVTSSANPAVIGQPLTITATVSVSGPSTRKPTGAVTFEDMTANVTLGPATLDANGVATINPTLPAGTHTIVANFAGDCFAGASSDSLQQETLLAIVEVDIREEIIVSDAVTPLPSAMLHIDEAIVVSDTVTPLPSAMLQIDEAIVVTDSVAPLPAAMLLIDEHITVADDVTPVPQGNTPVGGNVSVISSGVSLLFASVSRAGATSMTAIDPSQAPPAPPAFDYTNPPTMFEISTTAVFSGTVNVCMTYPAGSVSPRAMHFEGGAWIDRTTSTNTATRSVCASVTSFSPFAVFVPRAVEGRMVGGGALPGGHQFDFRVAERSIGTERGALSYKHETPKSGKQKARTDEFRATAIGEITFWDDQAYQPSRRPRPAVDSVVFTGTGDWNGVSGYSFEVEAGDEGEPGRGRDTFTIVIRDPLGAVVASSGGVLTAGNIQSQRLRKRQEGERQ